MAYALLDAAAAASAAPLQDSDVVDAPDFAVIGMWLIDPHWPLNESHLCSLATNAAESDGTVPIYPQYSTTKGAIAVGYVCLNLLAQPGFPPILNKLLAKNTRLFNLANFKDTTADTIIGFTFGTLPTLSRKELTSTHFGLRLFSPSS